MDHRQDIDTSETGHKYKTSSYRRSEKNGKEFDTLHLTLVEKSTDDNNMIFTSSPFRCHVILSPSFKIPIQKEDSQKCNEVNVWLQK
jgi:hypothetical protein